MRMNVPLLKPSLGCTAPLLLLSAPSLVDNEVDEEAEVFAVKLSLDGVNDLDLGGIDEALDSSKGDFEA